MLNLEVFGIKFPLLLFIIAIVITRDRQDGAVFGG